MGTTSTILTIQKLMKKVYILQTFTLLLMLPSLNFAQVNSTEKSYYKWFDAAVGVENTDLYNGVAYVEEFSAGRDNKRFFLSSDFKTGDVHYGGQSYYDIKMKYDVYGDQLIVNLISNSQESVIQLLKNKLYSFNIGTHFFENISDEGAKKVGISGYHEVLVRNPSCTLFKKYRKKKTKRLEKRFYYYEFSDNTSEFVVEIDGSFYYVKSKNDFIKLFPQYKKEINDFYAGSTLRTFSKEVQLKAIANKIDQISL